MFKISNFYLVGAIVIFGTGDIFLLRENIFFVKGGI